jgi:2-C-methyl-D-erythritol 4-phosphate cytidylyltransferase
VPTLAVLTAAGSGTRLGFDVPKALVELAGLPLVVHAARNLSASGVVDQIVVTCPPAHVVRIADLLHADPEVHRQVQAVAGGMERQDSVAAGLRVGLASLGSDDVDVVVVHDAARPTASPDLVRRVVAAVRSGHVAVVPGLPVVDTIKRVDADGVEPGVERVVATVDRAVLRAVQTPQGFDREVLVRAHAEAARQGSAARTATDDAGLVEHLGLPVHVVPGEARAAKITTAEDLDLARWRLAQRG